MSTEWSSSGAPYGSRGPSGPRASFGTRLVAYIIDAVIVGLAAFLLNLVGGRAGSVLGLFVGLAYFTYFEGSPSGQTIGKRAMNIRVVDFSTGGSIEYGRAALRYLMRLVSGFVCLLGYLWMLWDPERQTWHDKVANSVVVPTSAYPVGAWPG
ncbi:MAG TPA: RDD family protein [Acidimicrobiales bacterium]|nr:RDD family protein [Acidimicrobiales bacterium]